MLARTEDDQKETYARGQPLQAGETVVPGRYRCRACRPRARGGRWEDREPAGLSELPA